MRRKIVLELEEDLYSKFKKSLVIADQNESEVIEILLSDYASQVFSKAAKDLEISNLKLNNSNKPTMDYAKAKRKIPSWAVKPKLNTHKIIRAYFMLSDENKPVTVDMLMERCSDKNRYPFLYVPKFSQNFAQMKIDNGNSNGKVFETHNGTVTVWEEIAEILNQYKNKFLNPPSEEITNRMHNASLTKEENGVTQDMLIKCYEISKKIYTGRLQKEDGPALVNIATSMNKNAAAVHIEACLDMIGERIPSHSLSPHTIEFFSEKIRKDFHQS